MNNLNQPRTVKANPDHIFALAFVLREPEVMSKLIENAATNRDVLGMGHERFFTGKYDGQDVETIFTLLPNNIRPTTPYSGKLWLLPIPGDKNTYLEIDLKTLGDDQITIELVEFGGDICQEYAEAFLTKLAEILSDTEVRL
jgi:hypothetical protein